MERSKTTVLKDRLTIAIIIGILIIRFFSTLFFGKSISKLFLIAHWDSLFYPMRAGTNFNIDASLVLLHLPYRFFVANCWHHQVPLWNALSGFGMPLLADPQAFVLSPIFALFYLLPSIETWNVTLIIELAIGAISTYYLCRELEINFIGAFCGALLFTFCPWVQWQLELLGNGICMTPVVFLFFMRMAKRKSLWHAAIAGGAAAADILSAHPEMSFITIMFASIFVCLAAYYQDRSGFNFLQTLGRIGLAGIVAFGLSAPLLIPFGEYLLNGESYKLAGPTTPDISLQDLVANFLFPFYPRTSFYFGPLSWFGLGSILCFSVGMNRFLKPLLVLLLANVLTLARLFPLGMLYQIPPLSMVQAMYYMPVYILLMSTLSSIGINRYFTWSNGEMRIRIAIGFTYLMPLLVTPIVFYLWQHNYFHMHAYQLEAPRFDGRIWLFSIACAVVMSLVLLVPRVRQTKHLSIVIFAVLAVLNLMVISYKSLPTRPFFEYPKSLWLSNLSHNGTRILATGEHLFRPNTNVMYGLSTPKVHNPLFPKGFIDFMQASGAEVDEFNQIFPITVSRLLDITGVRTIISEQPILDKYAAEHSSSKAGIPSWYGRKTMYSKSLVLSNIELFCDSKTRTIFCRMIATLPLQQNDDYRLCFELKGENGIPAVFIEPIAIYRLKTKQAVACSARLPVQLKHWTLTARLERSGDTRIIPPADVALGMVLSDHSWLLATSEHPELFTEINNDRFKLLSSKGSIITYENKTAVNRYFFAGQVDWVKRSEVLKHLKAHANELNGVVILEDAQKSKFERLLRSIDRESQIPTVNFPTTGSISGCDSKRNDSYRTNSLALDLITNASKASLLVVSDLYYPGWKVFLDGSEWTMFRADYLFRAVLIPPGKHHIKFEYQPMSFITGLVLFFLTLATLFVSWFKQIVLRKVSDRKSGYEMASICPILKFNNPEIVKSGYLIKYRALA